jgi:outer membrane protein insertion porin family
MRAAPTLIALAVLAGCAPRDVRLEGDPGTSASTLLAAAQRPLARWRAQPTRADLIDAAWAMEEELRARGFAHASVEPPTDLAAPAVFRLHAGAQAWIATVTFTGNTALSHDALGAIAGLGTGRPWDADDLATAARRVAAAYRHAGFPDARVAVAPVEQPAGPVAVRLHVDEGRRLVIAAVEYALDSALDETAARALIADLLAPGLPFDPSAPRAAAARLRARLGAMGHLDARVVASEHIAAGAVTVRLAATAGAAHRLGAITVRGAARTRDVFIRGRFRDLDPGAPLRRDGIDEGVRALYRTGLFRRVTATPTAGAAGATDLAVTVEETEQRRIEVGAGWGSWEQLRGRVAVADDNLFGRGLTGELATFASLKGWGASGGLLDRHHLGPDRSLGLDVRFEERQEPSFLRRETSTALTLRDVFRVPADPDARWDTRTVYDLSANQDLRVDGSIADAEQPWYVLSAIGTTLRRDSRERSIVDPEQGTLAQVGVRWSAEQLGSQVPYLEASARWTHHRRLTPRLTGALNLAGAVRDPADAGTLPIGERYFLGGEDTVRSFAQDELGPRDANGDPIGGLSRAYGNVELRWRPLPDAPRWELSGFYDVGSLGQEAWVLDRPYGQGIGAGTRYVLPVGPIRLDAAYVLGERFGGEHPYALHLSAGFAF